RTDEPSQAPPQVIADIQKQVLNDCLPVAAEGGSKATVALYLFPHRTPLDLVLVEGIEEGSPGSRRLEPIWDAVSRALISDMDLFRDETLPAARPEEFRHFNHRLMHAFLARRPEEGAFGAWLTIEREHGFVRLLPGTGKLRGAGRAEARSRALRYFRL